jgi:hypothetical protein
MKKKRAGQRFQYPQSDRLAFNRGSSSLPSIWSNFQYPQSDRLAFNINDWRVPMSYLILSVSAIGSSCLQPYDYR